MRALELHAAMKQIQRSALRSSVAAAAYRSGERLKDERTDEIHDYRKKGGVEHSRIYTPDNAPEWARDRHKLWNACEAKENRKNSCTAREWEIAFPYEFNIMQRREAGETIAREMIQRYGCAVDIAFHKPSMEGDERNYHAHIMFTTRSFDPKTKDGWSRTKYRDLNDDKIEVAGKKTTRGVHEVKTLRKFAAQEMNRIAAREKMQIKTEYKSYAARGIDKIPTKKEGKEVTAMKRKGKKTRRAELNRRIKARNERNFKMLVGIQVKAQKRQIKKLSKKQKGRGFFASLFSLFTGGNKSRRAERTALKTSIGRNTEAIRNPRIEQQRQINRTGNDNRQDRTRDKDPLQPSSVEKKKEYLSLLHERVMERHVNRDKKYQAFIDRHNEIMSKPVKRRDFGRERSESNSNGKDHE
ncbi:MAG: MobA/MobL family protein [Alphaproteobacteria bacterium]|nr:MobA/MobL family protein [Alphaproteobacteria bacterium]